MAKNTFVAEVTFNACNFIRKETPGRKLQTQRLLTQYRITDTNWVKNIHLITFNYIK